MSNMVNWGEYIGEGLSGLLAGAVAFVLGRRTKKAEADSAQAGALNKMQESYDKFVEDFQHKYDGLKADMEDLKKKYKVVEEKLDECEKRNSVK